MKKAALTFALISTVMVATSFATPEEVSNKNLTTIIPISTIEKSSNIDADGNVVGQNKKRDAQNQVMIIQSNNVDRDGNVVGGNKKLD